MEPYYITLSYGTTSTCAQDPVDLLAPVLQKYPDIWIHIDAAYAGTALVCPEYANPSQPATNGEIAKPEGLPNGDITSQHVTSVPLLSPAGLLPQSSDVLKHVDSWNTNLHKWLLTAFDASLLYIRSRKDLTSALSITPAYLQNKHTDSGLVTDYRDWQIPLGRRFRSLKIWFVVRTYGIEGLRAHIRRTVRVGQHFERLVTESKEGSELFELVSKPAFGLTCFRIRPNIIPRELLASQTAKINNNSEDVETEKTMNGTPFGTVEQQPPQEEVHTEPAPSAEDISNALTKQVTETINDSCKLFLTSSSTHGKTFIRVVSGNANASEEAVTKSFETIVSTTREALASAVEAKSKA